MELILVIRETKRASVIADNSEQIEVSFAILDKNDPQTTLSFGVHGYPLTTSKEEIVADLKATLENFKAEMVSKEANKEIDAIDSKANETIDQLQQGIIQ